MEQERKFISDALQGVYLQFRDKDKWMTVRDYNPSSYQQLHFYDDKVRQYINLDLLKFKISYRDKGMNVSLTNDPNLLVRGAVSNRLRLAILSNNKWIYLTFDIEESEDGSPVMKPRASSDDPSAIKVVYKNDKTAS